MTYNLSNFSAANNVLDVAIASNQLVDGWFAALICVCIFGISFMAMAGRYELRHAMLSSGFISLILIAGMWGAGLATERAVVIAFVFLLFSVVVSTISD